MTALLKDLAREHAVLLIEHDMDFVFAVADWMTVMVEGAVLAEGQPDSDPRQHRRAARPTSGATRDAAPQPRAADARRPRTSTPTTARATSCAASRSPSAPARPSA